MAKILRLGHNSADLRDPIFWDPEDWSPEEWKALCKIFGLPPGMTERMVLHASELEYAICSPDRAVDYERTYIVTEYCPHCENEIEMRWDTDTRGFKAFCPVCGKRLMLCDECQHTGKAGGCDYNSETGFCRYNPQTISDIIDSKEPTHCSEQSVPLEMSTIKKRDATLETLWSEFGDIPMNPVTECMEEAFMSFPAGTHREEIWRWFDERHSKGVAYLLYR